MPSDVSSDMPWKTARMIGLLMTVAAGAAGCLDETSVEPESALSALTLLGGLNRGEALSLRGDEAERLFLPGGAAGSEFVIVTFFGTDNETSQITVDVRNSDLLDVVGPPPGALRTVDHRLRLRTPLHPWNYEFHLRLREVEIRELEPRLENATWRSGGRTVPRREEPSSTTVPSPATAPAAVPEVGDMIPLRVISDAGANLCESPLERSGRVAAVTNDVIMVSDTASPAELSDAQLTAIATEFDELVRPVAVENFGAPTDIDQNDRVIVLFTPVVNERGSGGFFFAGDLFPRSDCAASNEGEIFYILSPDPNGETPIRVDTERVAELATGIIGHELQHLVNAGRRIFVNDASTLEEVWLNEGLSHIAEELVFYRAASLSPRENIGLSRLQSSQQIVDAANRFLLGNLFRYAQYAAAPSEATFLGSDNSPTRGAAWGFLRYAADHEESMDSQFFFDLVNARTAGLANLNSALVSAAPLDVFQAWTASVFSDDQVAGVPTFLTQPSWNFRSILPIFTEDDSFPLAIQTINAGGGIQVELTGGGAAFFRVGVDPASTGEFRIDATGTFRSELRVSVVRAR